jgi:murein DD-endopeptidase MepM/ murein hydrolase activator NlpD
MAKTVFDAKVVQKYRNMNLKWYGPLGHRGLDLNYVNEPLPSPVTGQIVALTNQVQMGHCLYIRDIKGSIHVFAHLKEFKVHIHDQVTRGQIIATTGNTGTITSGPHLHYEILTLKPFTLSDTVMWRTKLPFTGYNCDPLNYLKALYTEYKVSIT